MLGADVRAISLVMTAPAGMAMMTKMKKKTVADVSATSAQAATTVHRTATATVMYAAATVMSATVTVMIVTIAITAKIAAAIATNVVSTARTMMMMATTMTHLRPIRSNGSRSGLSRLSVRSSQLKKLTRLMGREFKRPYTRTIQSR
jgi:hypothetical protein